MIFEEARPAWQFRWGTYMLPTVTEKIIEIILERIKELLIRLIILQQASFRYESSCIHYFNTIRTIVD